MLKKPTFEKILARMSKLDTLDNLDADKSRRLLSGMTENELLELSDNADKTKGKDSTESVFFEKWKRYR